MKNTNNASRSASFEMEDIEGGKIEDAYRKSFLPMDDESNGSEDKGLRNDGGDIEFSPYFGDEGLAMKNDEQDNEMMGFFKRSVASRARSASGRSSPPSSGGRKSLNNNSNSKAASSKKQQSNQNNNNKTTTTRGKISPVKNEKQLQDIIVIIHTRETIRDYHCTITRTI